MRLTRPRLALAVAVAILAGSLVGCRSKPRRPNVVVVLVDTLRVDRVGMFGGGRKLTPFLDSLAPSGFVFERAYAQAPWTNPSIASLFTGRYPAQHGVVTFSAALDPGEQTLAESLAADGYATGAFIANGLVSKNLGFSQGFERFDAYWAKPKTVKDQWSMKPRANEVNAHALEWLDAERKGADRPFFLYLHHFEPHPPFTPPESALKVTFGDRPVPALDVISASIGFLPFLKQDDPVVRDFIATYDAEVVSVDREIEALFGQLAARGLLDDTIFVFTADHGEELLDHGGAGHGHSLYEELIHVPLFVRWPRGVTPGRSDRPMQLIDVAPTLLDLLGRPPSPGFAGSSQAALLRAAPTSKASGESLDPAKAFSDIAALRDPAKPSKTGHRLAVIDGSRKTIERDDPPALFFDLAADPGEARPEGLDASARDALAEAAQRFRRDFAHQAIPAPPPVDAETRAKMKALGYAE